VDCASLVLAGHTGSLSTSFAHFFYLNRTSHILYAAPHLLNEPPSVDEYRSRLSIQPA
jgi:hypothetical protein